MLGSRLIHPPTSRPLSPVPWLSPPVQAGSLGLSLPATLPPARAGLHEGRRERTRLLCCWQVDTHPPPPVQTTGPSPGSPRRLEASPRSPLRTVSSGDKCQVPAWVPLPGASGDPGVLSQLQLLPGVQTARLPRGFGQPSPPQAGTLTCVLSGGTVLGHRTGCREFSYQAISVLPLIDASLIDVRNCRFPACPALTSSSRNI